MTLFLAIAAFVAAALLLGSYRAASATKGMHASLEAERLPSRGARYSLDQLTGLPAPVQKYFQTVLQEGQPIVSAVDIRHSGTMNMGEDVQKWQPFTSCQRVITQRPGFDWDARITMLRWFNARVHDAYIAGEGILYVTLFGLIPLANLRGTPQLAHGELLRFLAEAAWYPTALLPSQGVQWKPVDDSSAKATLHDGTTSVELLFRFSEEGLIQSIRAKARGRIVRGTIVPTPWEGQWRIYQSRDGMLIPTEGEVFWMLPEGPWPYWRGCITSVRYER